MRQCISLSHCAPEVVCAGDFEGDIKVWDLQKDICVSTLSCGGEKWERAVIKLALLPASSCGQWPLLVASSQDGLIKVWELQLENNDSKKCKLEQEQLQSSLIGQFQGSLYRQHCVTAMAVHSCSNLLYTGDQTGRVQVFNTRPTMERESAEKVAPFKQICTWQALQHAITSIQHMSSHKLVLLGCEDSTVSLWTPQGGLVGIFGQHLWSLADQSTWQVSLGVASLQNNSDHSFDLTPHQIVECTARKSNWDFELQESLERAGHTPMAGAAVLIATPAQKCSQAIIKSSLEEHRGSDSINAITVPESLGLDVLSLDAMAHVESSLSACQMLGNARHHRKLGRNSTHFSVSYQSHSSLKLYDLEKVPTDASEIWGLIGGYNSIGPQRSSISRRASSEGIKPQRCAEVQAILQKNAPAFSRSECRQRLRMLTDGETL